MRDSSERVWRRLRVRRGLRTAMRHNGEAYGFSVTITAGLAVVSWRHPDTDGLRILLFTLGATAAFAVLEFALTAGFRQPLDEEPSVVVARGVSLSFLSVSVTTALAWGMALLADGILVWPLTGFAVSLAYPLLSGLELAAAEEAVEEDDEAAGGAEDDGTEPERP